MTATLERLDDHHVRHQRGDAIARLRDDVLRLAETDVPVLIRGSSGAGKELAARAIHAASRRSNEPFVALNVAALTESIATSELFGHVRGAFTGAITDHRGAFERAHGGVLFLDEIGDAPPSVQPMLLRVLETGEVLPVGGRVARPVDVRVISATDVDLETAVDSKQFRAPLLHRLAGVTLYVPSLAQRPDDIARLFFAFLGEELSSAGQAARLSDTSGTTPFVSAAVVSRLIRAPWPGNVRQLRNFVRQVVLESREGGRVTLESVEAMLSGGARTSQGVPSPAALDPRPGSGFGGGGGVRRGSAGLVLSSGGLGRPPSHRGACKFRVNGRSCPSGGAQVVFRGRCAGLGRRSRHGEDRPTRRAESGEFHG